VTLSASVNICIQDNLLSARLMELPLLQWIWAAQTRGGLRARLLSQVQVMTKQSIGGTFLLFLDPCILVQFNK
jgi:hypothetical protein